jgi:hypothetical protein
MDLQITNAHLWCSPGKISRFSGETEDPRSWVFQVDLGIPGMNRWESNATPTTEFDEVFDSGNGDLEDIVSTVTHDTKRNLGRTPSIAGCLEMNRTLPVGESAIYNTIRSAPPKKVT